MSPSNHQPTQPRLTIELVPQTCWFSNVRSEVSSEAWEKLKRMTFQRANYQCEICSSRGSQWPVECHEVWHYDDQQRLQTLVGLIALCPACHEVKHMGLANVRGRGTIAAGQLAKVNRWTKEQTQAYITSQFEVWEKRSKYAWQLDIRWLEQFDIHVQSRRSGK
jgi:hypothetical protein